MSLIIIGFNRKLFLKQTQKKRKKYKLYRCKIVKLQNR